MYQQIKKLADDAIALQNKDRMDTVLREISAMCATELQPVSVVLSIRPAQPTTPGEEMIPVVDEMGEHLMAIDAATRTPGSTVHIDDVPALVEKAKKIKMIAGDAIEYGDAVVAADGVAKPAKKGRAK